jgi:hypothetical protein
MKSFSSPESELRIRLAARKLPYLTYRKLADWLGVYEYVPPESRITILLNQLLYHYVMPLNCMHYGVGLITLNSLYIWMSKHVCIN